MSTLEKAQKIRARFASEPFRMHDWGYHAAFEFMIYSNVLQREVRVNPDWQEDKSAWILLETGMIAATKLFQGHVPDSDLEVYMTILHDILEEMASKAERCPEPLVPRPGPGSPEDADYLGTPWSEDHPD